ncbi:MAG: M16 family metallopeptidase, partial [Dehalococcoidia bacterium]
ALPGLARRDPDRYTLMVLNNLLGRGMSSRLFKEVRERRGLAYSVGSSVVRHSDTGVVVISAGVGRDNLEEALRVTLGEVAKLAQEDVGEEELARARDYSIGSFRLGLESTMALGQRAGELLLTMGDIEPIESVVAKLQAVNADDVQRVAGRIWQADRTALAVVGPDLHQEALLALLAA